MQETRNKKVLSKAQTPRRLVQLLNDHDALALVRVVLAAERVRSDLDAHRHQRLVERLAVVRVDVDAARGVWHVDLLVPARPVACKIQIKTKGVRRLVVLQQSGHFSHAPVWIRRPSRMLGRSQAALPSTPRTMRFTGQGP